MKLPTCAKMNKTQLTIELSKERIVGGHAADTIPHLVVAYFCECVPLALCIRRMRAENAG